MKRFILTMVAMLTLGAAANAMSYKQAREQALFLSDKMAYELGLSDDQYNAVYEINMDYIMCLDTFELYIQLEYFYRPVSWENKRFVFTIYNRYSKDRFYRVAPPGYQVYKGSNRYFDHSAYKGRNYGEVTTKSQPKPGTVGTQHSKKSVSKSQTGSKSQPGGTMTKKQAVNQGKQQMNKPTRH